MQNASTRVETLQGSLSGRVDEDIHLWYGIPYAAPPVGSLRWRAPQPVMPWQGVRPAETFRLPVGKTVNTARNWAAAIRAASLKIVFISTSGRRRNVMSCCR